MKLSLGSNVYNNEVSKWDRLMKKFWEFVELFEISREQKQCIHTHVG